VLHAVTSHAVLLPPVSLPRNNRTSGIGDLFKPKLGLTHIAVSAAFWGEKLMQVGGGAGCSVESHAAACGRGANHGCGMYDKKSNRCRAG
jgi:hypothetical protein